MFGRSFLDAVTWSGYKDGFYQIPERATMREPSVNQNQPLPAMPAIGVTTPMFVSPSEVWFSAYGFGWGYAAFALPTDAVLEQLGAATTSDKQMTLAFELGKRRIRQAVCMSEPHSDGERKVLVNIPS